VRELQSFKETPHGLLCLRILQREKSNGLGQKDGKEAKESKSKEGSRIDRLCSEISSV